MKQVRVGLVGTGFAGEYHVECLRRIYGAHVEIAAVTSLRPESRQAFGARHGIDVYADIEAMLPHIDLLDICSPPYAHEDGILRAAAEGRGIICEKPLTGSFGPPQRDETWFGDRAPKAPMLADVLERLGRIADAVRDAGVFFGYAENFVYAPSVQKERDILEKTGAQILRMTGEESHNGSASNTYGIWQLAGGGSLIGKGCHPLGGILYLKRVEGLARNGRPIRPATVSARVHEITRLDSYRDQGFIRTDYHDIEDYGMMHLTFEDGTVADVITCELVLGGIYDYLDVFANNHRTRCHLSPVEIVDTYNPGEKRFDDVYLVEKCSTQEGWSMAAPDENFTLGYQPELQDFIQCAATGVQPQSGLDLALDTTAAIYAAYVSAEAGGNETDVPQL
jgi:predicted dehydrogenase